MAELVVIPKLIEDLLFLHLGGELFLLKTSAAALKLQQAAVGLLTVLIGLCSASFKLHALCVYLRDLGLYLLGLREYIIALLQNGIELRIYLLAGTLCLFYGALSELTVARQALREHLQLLDRGVSCTHFRLT